MEKNFKYVEITPGIFVRDYLSKDYSKRIENWCNSMQRNITDFGTYLTLIGLNLPIYLGVYGPGFCIENTSDSIDFIMADVIDTNYSKIILNKSYKKKQKCIYVSKIYHIYKKFWKEDVPKVSLHNTYIRSDDDKSLRTFDVYHEFPSYTLCEHISGSKYYTILECAISDGYRSQNQLEGNFDKLAKRIYDIGTKIKIMELYKIAIECTGHPEYMYFFEKSEQDKDGFKHNSTGKVFIKNGKKTIIKD